jgi:aminoglycoside phosphotransferase
MLDTTLATEFIPGTNLQGDVVGANWSYLLPNRELDQIVCLGAPPIASVMTLARIGRDVAVVSTDARASQQLGAASRRQGRSNVRVLAAGGAALPFADSSVDLLLIADARGVQRLFRDPALQAEIQRVLTPAGLLYCEPHGLGDPAAGRAAGPKLLDGFGVPQLFWITPRVGEMQTAVPLHDAETTRYFYRHSLYSPSLRLRPLRRAEQFLRKRKLFSGLMQRTGMLVGGTAAGLDERPPQYLRTLAQRAGIDLDQHRWGLSARSRFNSRKVLFFLFAPSSDEPEYIVKLTRDAAYNARLENECHALRLLHDRGLSAHGALPEVVFFGHHSDLAIVGETAINGAQFRARTKATADCPYARSAIDWLIDLGAATADPTAATPPHVAERLELLFNRFAQHYQLAPADRDFLTEQIALIAGSPAILPLVFQHGDSGVWNVMVRDDGVSVFLDWEAAEPQGMPLWDLFYFIRSFAMSVARTAGKQDSLSVFRQQFITDAPLSPLLIEATKRYCTRSGVPTQLVAPLFYTCWMHRALKEVTRLSAARLEQGHYVNLLRLCIEQRNAPVFRSLFSL